MGNSGKEIWENVHAEGREREKIETIINMNQQGLSLKLISNVTKNRLMK